MRKARLGLQSIEREAQRLKTLLAGAGVAVFNNANIPVPSGAWTSLTFNTERWDDAAFHSVVANTNRLTVPTGYAGRYVITGHIIFAASGAGTYRGLCITLNAARTQLAIQRAPFDAATETWISVPRIYNLSAGDYVELRAIQDTGGNLNVIAWGNASPEFSMERIG